MSVTVNGYQQLATEGQQFLHALADAGWPPEDVERTAAAWGVLQNDVIVWKAKWEEEQSIDREECEILTAITAAMSAYVLEHHATVNTPAIANATPEQLEEYAEWYDSELRTKYERMNKIITQSKGQHHDDCTYLKLFADFHRLAGYAWQVRHRLGEL